MRTIMTTTATQDTETLINMLRSAAADLSPSVINALIACPDAVRGALAATGALLARDETGGSAHDEIETIGLVAEPSRSPEEVRRIVESRTIPYEPDEEVLSSNEVAVRLGLKSRQSVHDWLRKGKIVGWQTARRGYMFPARQLDERNGCRSDIDSSCGTFAWKRHHVAGDDDLLTIGLGEQRPRLVEA